MGARSIIEEFQSDFRGWLDANCTRVKMLSSLDRYSCTSPLTSAQLINQFDLAPATDLNFPEECPISAGEGAYIKTKDGWVAVFVEGWSSTCRGSHTPAEVIGLGAEAIRRWQQEATRVGVKLNVEWEGVQEEDYWNGLTFYLAVGHPA